MSFLSSYDRGKVPAYRGMPLPSLLPQGHLRSACRGGAPSCPARRNGHAERGGRRKAARGQGKEG